MYVDDARVVSSVGLTPHEESCVAQSVYVAEVDLRPGDPTLMGFPKTTELIFPRVAEIEFRKSWVEVVGKGVTPPETLTVEQGFDAGLTACGVQVVDVDLHWDPETGLLLDVGEAESVPTEQYDCVRALLKEKVKPLRYRFFPRADVDTYQRCRLAPGAAPDCEASPLFSVVEG